MMGAEETTRVAGRKGGCGFVLATGQQDAGAPEGSCGFVLATGQQDAGAPEGRCGFVLATGQQDAGAPVIAELNYEGIG